MLEEGGLALFISQSGETADTLAARVLAQEHRLYPRVLAYFARDPAAARRNRIAIFPGDR